MKKNIIIPAFFFILASFSCRKSYNCVCTTTLSMPGYLPYQTGSVEAIQKNTSKKKATIICKSTAQQIQANTRLLFADNVSVETGCTLQENN